MTKKKILTVVPMRDTYKEKLREVSEGCDITYSSYEEVDREMVQEANIIIGNVPAWMIGMSKNLELLQLNSSGTDAYMGVNILNENTVMTSATGAYGKAVGSTCLPCSCPYRRSFTYTGITRTAATGPMRGRCFH